jgi:hypothetical protein
MIRSPFISLFVIVLMSACASAASGDQTSAVAAVAGKWQFSWEARIGTERGTLQLEQSDSKLTGSYRGNIATQNVSGTVDGEKVTLNFDFQRAHPFTIIFTGTTDGDKMSGKFEIKDFKDAYDSHGESARPSNYSWSAVRLTNETYSAGSSSARSDSAK